MLLSAHVHAYVLNHTQKDFGVIMADTQGRYGYVENISFM